MEAELAEIDENLIRENLTPAQEAIAIKRRAELIMALEKAENGGNAEDKPGSNEPGLGKGGRGKKKKAPASQRDLAEKTGLNNTRVHRGKKRGDLGMETLEAVTGTCLDQAGELDARHAVFSL